MLTLLLTLKDRFNYTENILNFFNVNKFKYPIIISDGSSIQNQQKLKRTIHNYDNLNLKILNYNPDNSYTDYYNKLHDSSLKIHTKYTLLIDNDDYFSEKSCTEAINFLESNQEYIAAGQICHFINHKNSLYYHNVKYNSFDDSNLNKRIHNYLNNPLTIWGLVTRTDIVVEIFEIFTNCNFKYLHLNEFLFNLYLVSKGKIKYLHDYPCTFRRMISSESSSSTFLGETKHYNFYYKDYFYTDWRKLVEQFYQLNIDEKLLEEYWFRGCINGNIKQSKYKNYFKNNIFFRSLYYKIKYRKCWSQDIKKFDLNFRSNLLA